jgi:hypothetical protein
VTSCAAEHADTRRTHWHETPCAAEHADTLEFTSVSRRPYLSEIRQITPRPVPLINASTAIANAMMPPAKPIPDKFLRISCAGRCESPGTTM